MQVVERSSLFPVLFTPHAQRERGKVIGVGVHMFICLWTKKKNLNRTLAIDSPFQTYAVGLLVEFIDLLYHCSLQKSSPR